LKLDTAQSLRILGAGRVGTDLRHYFSTDCPQASLTASLFDK